MTLKQSLLSYLTAVQVVFGSSREHLTKVNLIPNLNKKPHLFFVAFIFDSFLSEPVLFFWALGGAPMRENMDSCNNESKMLNQSKTKATVLAAVRETCWTEKHQQL